MGELLAGLSCLITGASRGIGRAIALLYAQESVGTLYLAARSVAKLEEVAKECRKLGAKKVVTLEVDLSKPCEAKKFGERMATAETGGQGVDILVNNAGVYVYGSAQKGTVDEWDLCTNVNLLAPMILTRQLTPSMQSRGKGYVINIGSIAGVEPMSDNGLYSASKWGMRGWSLHAYRNLRSHGIKVMLINPGFVDTDMVAGRGGLNYGRMIKPMDIAQGALMPFRTSDTACPEELTIRPLKPVLESTD